MTAPTCPYCEKPAEFSPTSRHVYKEDFGPVWQCLPCLAWVQCHPQTSVALGTPARRELRQLRLRVHQYMDELWRYGDKGDRTQRRTLTYMKLAEKMGIPFQECHVGQFNEVRCLQALEILIPQPH
jgi:hypothetical protein